MCAGSSVGEQSGCVSGSEHERVRGGREGGQGVHRDEGIGGHQAGDVIQQGSGGEALPQEDEQVGEPRAKLVEGESRGGSRQRDVRGGNGPTSPHEG